MGQRTREFWRTWVWAWAFIGGGSGGPSGNLLCAKFCGSLILQKSGEPFKLHPLHINLGWAKFLWKRGKPSSYVPWAKGAMSARPFAKASNGFESFAKAHAQRPVQACFQTMSLVHFELGDSLAGAKLGLIL